MSAVAGHRVLGLDTTREFPSNSPCLVSVIPDRVLTILGRFRGVRHDAS